MTIQTPVGIAGPGRIGAAIARHLLALGRPFIVWNHDPGRVAPLIEDSAAAQVYGGPDGLLASEVSSQLFIDMSTVSSADATKGGRVVAETDADFVECPISGSGSPVPEGKPLGIAGAEEIALNSTRPFLELLYGKIVHAGPVGAGARLKLMANLPLRVYWQTLGGAMNLGTDNWALTTGHRSIRRFQNYSGRGAPPSQVPHQVA